MNHVWQMDSLLIFFPNYRQLIAKDHKKQNVHSRQIHESVAKKK